ncbi:HAD family hydrolase [Bradyrhizobium zhanjiangense]|uniref:phosphoglycolate phosphatase n=1 Tax=Bradyrhizobium zhanjiangense TaxID=1325107 RepID=A0A4Q0QB92_9BRAD|nr:HAD hydrolase-like protein [Bradyrhizobium zhanjiangense]RXG86546.1 HAD family hydrolase [Bradyrhizobium zhanjiangense]
MTRTIVDTLIVDLDNTLFDWLSWWHAPFSITYDEISTILGGERAEAEIRRIHRRQGTSDYEYLLEELLGAEAPQISDIRRRVEQRTSSIKRRVTPYRGVTQALAAVKSIGARIVVCTESMEQHAVNRLCELGLLNFIDELFCREGHSVPAYRDSNANYREFLPAQVRMHHLRPGLSKPDPRILYDLVSVVGSDKQRTAYVGDSLTRDVLMARNAGILALHARYGETRDRIEFELLARVSHWTSEDVSRELELLGDDLSKLEAVTVLEHSFSEIFDYLTFERFTNAELAAPSN